MYSRDVLTEIQVYFRKQSCLIVPLYYSTVDLASKQSMHYRFVLRASLYYK